MPKITCPKEEAEQIALIEWRDIWAHKFPELNMLYAIPNGGFRAKRTAVVMRQTGTKKGTPDLHLPIPKGIYASLYIELKRTQGGSLSPDQKLVIADLKRFGNRVEVCKGCRAAIAVIADYLGLKLILTV
jgi:VRR-NUC domain